MARILIVEDNDILSNAYGLVLTHHGHVVESAHDGMKGLAQAKTFYPELILLDMLMPNLDGIGFLKAYDCIRKHPDVKIVLLTNINEESLVTQALDLGAQQYVLKAELAPKELVALVDRLLEKKRE